MSLTLLVPKERLPGENRVALVPTLTKRIREWGINIALETDAGSGCCYQDQDYHDVNIIEDINDAYATADIILKVRAPTEKNIAQIKPGALLIALMDPYHAMDLLPALCKKQITTFAMELIPRISRAQGMDVLSSQASLSGYKGAIIAADLTHHFLPMMTTAAGTIRPAKVLVIGIGVAGLQAIATAHRLGAIVEAYDVRPETKEQAESVGARFIDIGVKASDQGGYARELSEAEKKRQREILVQHVQGADIILCTAGVPGKAAPKIISKDMVSQMKPGSVIVDLVAELGGNCELTQPGENISHHHTLISGPVNLPSLMPIPASEMYAKNALNLLQLMIKDQKVHFDWDDEIIAKTALTHAGQICHEVIRKRMEEK